MNRINEFLSRRGTTSAARGRRQTRRISIKGTYQPEEIHIWAGEPARLIFRREETASCSECVVFPDFGISVMLPAFEDVAVDLPAMSTGEHEFTCQMRMLHGTLVVDAVNGYEPRSASASARKPWMPRLPRPRNQHAASTESSHRPRPGGTQHHRT